jgi:hypothetical protein
MPRANLHLLVGEIMQQCIREGIDIELDGLGVFRRGQNGAIAFEPANAPRVFIAYVAEDFPLAVRLYHDLEAAAFSPWLDRMKLLPGQNWRRAIDRALDTSDFVIACFSQQSTQKRGQFPYEVRIALRAAERMLLDDVYFLPLRFETCEVPQRIANQTQYVDMFPDWDRGLGQLIESIRTEWTRRQRGASCLDDKAA